MKSAIPLAVAAALLAGCGSDDEDAADTVKRPATGTETAPPAPEGTAVFRSDAIPFTFEYPEEMAAETEPHDGVLGQVSTEPGGRLNAIKLRRTADRELEPDRYLDEFQHDFAKAVGTVEKREETIGGRRMGVLEFEDSIEDSGETTDITSSSYFFTGAGRTWQIECIADPDAREEIEAACRAALESLEFPKKNKKPAARSPKQVD